MNAEKERNVGAEQIIAIIEDMLEERKEAGDRRQQDDPQHPHAQPQADRRSGRDRRNAS